MPQLFSSEVNEASIVILLSKRIHIILVLISFLAKCPLNHFLTHSAPALAQWFQWSSDVTAQECDTPETHAESYTGKYWKPNTSKHTQSFFFSFWHAFKNVRTDPSQKVKHSDPSPVRFVFHTSNRTSSSTTILCCRYSDTLINTTVRLQATLLHIIVTHSGHSWSFNLC